MKNKNEYVKPEIEIIVFTDAEAIITDSAGNANDNLGLFGDLYKKM